MPRSVYFEDDAFLDSLVSLLITDRTFCKQYAGMLEPDDFKARTEALHSNDRWLIASKALELYQRYRDPVGSLIMAELKNYAKISRLSDLKRKKLLKLARGYLQQTPASAAIADHVVEFKQQVLKANALDEITELQGAGQLTDEKWTEITRKAILQMGEGTTTVDFYSQANERALRRLRGESQRFPYLGIKPIDLMVRAIPRGGLGLLMAPFKGRKSVGLLHIAVAYTLQGLNCLFYTLEDPLEEVENRLDSTITKIPIKLLDKKTALFQKRFPRFKRFVGNRLKIIDSTGVGLTLAQVEQDLDRLALEGFKVDAVFIDYDDEIIPAVRNKDRRFEFAQIYRDYRRLLANRDLFGWTAAQCTREAEGAKIITGKLLAEDVSKARKVHLAIGIGKGDWGEDSNYLYIAAHKHDKRYIGANIMGNGKRMIFCDEEATDARRAKERVVKKKKP